MGAELIEVESSMKIADFGDFYSSSEKLQHLVPQMDYCRTPIQELPLLVVQFTRFACGGLSVGMCMSHVVADGRSAFHFVEEWVRLTRGEPVRAAPFLDRQVLLAENVDVSTKPEVVDLENLSYYNGLESGKQATPTFVLLTMDEIDRLIKVANSDRETTNKNGRPYSRYEVITTHVWRCACKAREVKGEDITSVIVPVDTRGRMDPPLPSSYFGNAVVDIKVTCSAGNLISRPLSYGCSKIREAITKVTNEYVLDFIKFLKNQHSLTKYQYNDDRGKLQGPSYGDHNLMATSWLNMMARAVDFGWGKPIYHGPPLVSSCDGDIMIIPYTNDGSVLVGAFLQPKLGFKKYMSLPIMQCES